MGWATDGRIMHMRGTVSPRNLASAVGGRLPGGSAVADIMSGPTAYREFSCGTAVEHLFAPDISVFTPDLGGVFEPDAVLADDRGTYQRYEKDNLSSFVSALRGTYGRTTSPDYSRRPRFGHERSVEGGGSRAEMDVRDSRPALPSPSTAGAA